MVYEKDELEQYFKDEIHRVSQVEIQQIEDEITNIRERAIRELEHNVQQEAGMYLEQELKELQSEHAICLSKVREETNRKLMAKRQELSDRIFTSVKEKLQEFVNSETYVAFMEKKANVFGTYGYEGVTLYVRKEDMQYASNLQNAFGNACNVQVDDEIVLGGIRLECPTNGRMIDETFDTVIDEQREWFYTNSGLFVK